MTLLSMGVRYVCQLADHTQQLSLDQTNGKTRAHFSSDRTLMNGGLVPSNLSHSDKLPPIVDICQALVKTATEGDARRSLRWVLDESHRHNVYYVRQVADSLKSQSLEDLITSSFTFTAGQNNEGFLFSQRDRLRLAVNLACRFLQFHGSWLRDHWRARYIMFTSESPTVLGIPYISWNVGGEAGVSRDQNSVMGAALIRSQILFPLGLLLVELSLCQTLEILSIPPDADPQEAVANLTTAARLLPSVMERSGPEHARIAEQCLFWHGIQDSNLERETRQEKVFELVIVPLMENLRSFEDWWQRY